MAFGLPDLTKLPDDVQPIVSDLFTRLNALECKLGTDAAALIHGSLAEGLADAQALENPLLTRIDAMQQTLDKAVNALLVYQNGFSVVPAISPRELPPKP